MFPDFLKQFEEDKSNKLLYPDEKLFLNPEKK